MPKGAGITIGRGWVGEAVSRDGKSIIMLTRPSDKSSLIVKEKINNLGEKSIEIVGKVKTSMTPEEIIDLVGEASSVIPGYSWMGEAAAALGKRGVHHIKEYHKRLREIEESAVGGNVDINAPYTDSRTAFPRVDPMALDLDGDGLETIGIDSQRPILFDHDGDGIKTATGWIKADDGILVIDRNGNGLIDSGRELFGDSPPLYQGGLAADGFAALAQEDTNGDGLVNAQDARWNQLRIWRDHNQDGISQTNELTTF